MIARIGSSRSHRRLLFALAAALCALAYGALHASPARAAFGIASFDGSTTDQAGNPYTQAGGRPFDVTTSFNFTTDQNGKIEANVKDIQVQLPPGLVGDPTATPKCTFDELDNNKCPTTSQVGTLTLDIPSPFPTKVYNMVPRANEPAQFAASVLTANAVIDISVRTGGDYGLTATLTNIPSALPIYGSSLTFFGIPADQNGGGAERKPFLTLPTACAGPLTTTLRVDTWQNPGDFQTASFVSHDNQGNPVSVSGCDKLAFNPSLNVAPDTAAADSPAGFSVDLHIPQNDNPDGLATAQLKNAVVTLPAGVSIDPSAANGLRACTQAQFGLDNANEPTCPNASKIGSAEIDSPIQADPLTGGIYLAQQGKNPFGSLLAIYVAVESDGVLIKLAGHIVPDPRTGQLTTTFSDSPQLPFTDFKLGFFGGPRAALATPESCGTFTATSDIQPYSAPDSGPDATPSAAFPISSGCVSAFKPKFVAGSQNAQAGAYTPFALSFRRSDTNQEFSGLKTTLPKGVLAKLAGVAQCTGSELAAAAAASGAQEKAHPSCPAGSQVGRAEVGSGPGPDSEFLPGKVYLTGPYKGAPFGLAVVVPAVAGPLDLGTVVVRQQLQINPNTTQVTDVSDPLPTILQGIPLRVRRVDVVLNRKQFALNPTNCAASRVTGMLTSTGDTKAPVQSRFQVGGCAAMPFSPRLALGLSGKGQTRSGNHPTLTATVTQPARQANLHQVKVTLPLSLALDPKNSNHVCPFEVAKKVTTGPVPCPTDSLIGKASAVTPILSKPLRGNVYLVQGIKTVHGHQQHTLPTLLLALRGQIALNLRSQTAVNKHSQLVSNFPAIPDAPVSRFTLQINGGPRGILVITGNHRNICTQPQIAAALIRGQNGKQLSRSITMTRLCEK